ncbi:hypothetical protein [Pseudodesulfovibrio sediminis]|uniref:Response regulatory domain-containing protein n=1 Tax=Pseudodesulfovibrio sediminis TaxID=2810563 RepID=A0ABM7P7Y5_9BACT|nr:hypothetical protein [Pseudodesulfovibrio sediminis]BCS89069.1 hypothetical protein PSDVSF_23110 [Pseudodesulfovibrio sediminis]
MSILVASTRADALAEFTNSLAATTGQDVEIRTTGEAIIDSIKATPPSLVVVDEGLNGFAPLALVLEIVKISAMTHTAVVTDMDGEEFHEKSEGLGVLMPLPVNPGKADAEKLAEALGRM